MNDGLLLIVLTTHRRYAIRRDQVLGLRKIACDDDLQRPDDRGKPVTSSDLGSLLEPQDQPAHRRRHAVIIPTRRRSVALVVDRVENLYPGSEEVILPFPKLLSQRLARPWFLGVLIENENDMPVLVLDVRQIAQDVLMKMRSQTNATNHEQHRQVNHA